MSRPGQKWATIPLIDVDKATARTEAVVLKAVPHELNVRYLQQVQWPVEEAMWLGIVELTGGFYD